MSPGEDELKGDILNNWGLEEAYAKYLGTGLNLDFRDVSIKSIVDNGCVYGVEFLALYGACAIMVICECGEVRYCYWYLFSS